MNKTDIVCWCLTFLIVWVAVGMLRTTAPKIKMHPVNQPISWSI